MSGTSPEIYDLSLPSIHPVELGIMNLIIGETNFLTLEWGAQCPPLKLDLI